MSKQYWWIKERNNPQLKSVYFTGCGKMTIAEARQKEKTLYGSNRMLRFDTEVEYQEALNKLVKH